ncbi:hypothetical protein ACROYT_G002005 [Oculina patagonica]
MDIAFMVDASGSIHPSDFLALKDLITKVSSQFVVISTGAHVALMTFADSANDQYFFKDKQDIASIHQAIRRLSHPGGGSDMVIAFNEARRLFSSAEGGRDLVKRVLVIATDADFMYPNLAVNSSQQVKDEGIVIIGLGISSKVNTEMLKTIASSEDQILIFPDFTSPVKVDITGDLTAMMCEVARRREAVVSVVKENSALRGHVIMSLQAESEMFCALMCLNIRTCFSFNYKTNRQVCELNHTSAFTSPNDFIFDLDSVYYEMVFT